MPAGRRLVRIGCAISGRHDTLRRAQLYSNLRTCLSDVLTLSHLGLWCPDPDRTARFYERVVGLARHEPSGDAVVLGLGSGHHVLELREGSRSEVRVGYEVAGDGLEVVALRLRSAGIATEEHPRGLVVTDPHGNRLELHGAIDRSGEGQGGHHRRPDRLHHVTLASVRLEEMTAFYVEALGFRVSDEMVDGSGVVFVWLRSDREHHSLAIVNAPAPELDHLAFEVASWNVLGGWCDELARLGVPLTWGPGRHGPGNNLFAFFDDPDGRHIELSCEMERFWDDRAQYVRPPRQWSPGAGAVNLWGPQPSWRRTGGEV
jgi:catechol 2,3-dioxygenase